MSSHRWLLRPQYKVILRPTWCSASYRATVNHEYRFLYDMDWPPDWGDIYAIAFYDFASCCPICLEDFVAPLITPCGPIFCAHCIYKVTSPRLQSTCTIDVYKCPICSQIGVTRELLRHLIFHKVEPKVGALLFCSYFRIFNRLVGLSASKHSTNISPHVPTDWQSSLHPSTK